MKTYLIMMVISYILASAIIEPLANRIPNLITQFFFVIGCALAWGLFVFWPIVHKLEKE